MKTVLLVSALATLLAQTRDSPSIPATPPATSSLPEQLSVERWFVGRWICQGTMRISPAEPAARFTDEFTFSMVLGGAWLTYHIDQTMGPVKGKETLIGSMTWDANAKVHVRRDMNMGGSRVDATTPGWDGDKLVFTGHMVVGDEKVVIKQTFTRQGGAAFDSALEVTGADGTQVEVEQATCKKLH